MNRFVANSQSPIADRKTTNRDWRLAVRACFVVLGLALFMSGGASAQNDSYTNPVSKDFADTFADPAVIKAKDGYWYAFGTSDPLKEGEGDFHIIPISRSTDLVNWEYVGDAFEEPTEVPWAAEDASIWAPDIRYIDGEYYMYYVVTQTGDDAERDDNAIGVATAPTPAGPWTDSGEPVVGPREGNGGFLWTFDPTQFTDDDGTSYLYYGSYNGGVFVTELSEDGTRAVGEPTMVAIDNRYEGAYVIQRDGHYYLFASSANCCAGPTTGYSVYVGRSDSPKGPFLDKEGQSMTESRVGGSIVVTPNGNKWIGPGHNSIVTDLSGEDFFAYHAIDRADPYLDGTSGINERPMLIDRLDWVDGWPTVRGGQWASEDEQTAPVTEWVAGSDFNDKRDFNKNWRKEGGAWKPSNGEQEGGYVRRQDRAPKESYFVSKKQVPAEVRAEADLRMAEDSGKPPRGPKARERAVGLVTAYKGKRDHVAAWLDPEKNALVTDAIMRGRSAGERETPLPENFRFDTWHNVAVEIRGSEMTVEVTDARLNDPLAVQERTLPAKAVRSGSVGVASRGAGGEADNIGAAALYEPKTEVAPQPEVGGVDAAFSDEFDDGELDESDDAWSWVREPDGEESGGAYNWPTQAADLARDSNDASVLLRDAPDGDYTVETKLDIDLGTETVRNFQQGGLIVYAGDDHFLRLSHVAIFNTRQTEYSKEMPYAGGVSFGGMLVGPPSDTTWLRLSHRTDPENGEHEYRAATSRDGENWVWGGVWTLPADAEPRIGLISHGGDDPQATSEFDYFRVHRP